MTQSAEVGIVGGGIHGASAAFHLAERGVSTVLFERGGAASGPTGRSSAVCRAYYTNDFLAEVAREALDFFASFAEHTGGRDAGYRVTGGLFLHGDDDVAEVRETAQRLNTVGTEIEVLTAEELGPRYPRIVTDGLGCAAWEPRAGYADPAGATQGLLERASELGAEVRTHTPVVEIIAGDAGGAVLVAHDGARLRVERLLLAAGPWTRRLAACVGVDLPLTVERHIVATFEWGSADPIPFVLADVTKGYYQKPEGERQFFVGPLLPAPQTDPDDFDEQVSDEESVELGTSIVERVPALAHAVPRGGWASLYDVSPDWQPVIGEIADGILVDAGSSGHGFKLAPALGRHVADLVVGDDPHPDLRQFSPERFRRGSALHSGYGDARILG